MSKKKGHTFQCGCVAGFYWCVKHDIYTKQSKNDPPPHRVSDYDTTPSGCSCHSLAPCSWCVENLSDD